MSKEHGAQWYLILGNMEHLGFVIEYCGLLETTPRVYFEQELETRKEPKTYLEKEG